MTESIVQQWGYLDLAVPHHVLVKRIGKVIVWNNVDDNSNEIQAEDEQLQGIIASTQTDPPVPPALSPSPM